MTVPVHNQAIRPKGPDPNSANSNKEKPSDKKGKRKKVVVSPSDADVPGYDEGLPAWVDEKDDALYTAGKLPKIDPGVKFQRTVTSRRASAGPSNMDVAFTMLRSVGPPEWRLAQKPRLIYEAACLIPKLQKRIDVLEAQDHYSNMFVERLMRQCAQDTARRDHENGEPRHEQITSSFDDDVVNRTYSGTGSIFNYEEECSRTPEDVSIEPSLLDLGHGQQEVRARDAMHYFFNTAVDESYSRPVDIIANGVEVLPTTEQPFPTRLRYDESLGPENNSASKLYPARLPLRKSDSNLNVTPSDHLRRTDLLASVSANSQRHLFNQLAGDSSSPFTASMPSIPVHHLVGPKLLVDSISPGKENQPEFRRVKKVSARKPCSPQKSQ